MGAFATACVGPVMQLGGINALQTDFDDVFIDQRLGLQQTGFFVFARHIDGFVIGIRSLKLCLADKLNAAPALPGFLLPLAVVFDSLKPRRAPKA